VEVEKLESMERLLYANRYTSKEVWKRDGEGTVWRELIGAGRMTPMVGEMLFIMRIHQLVDILLGEYSKMRQPLRTVEHYCIIT
jgi:hypothetical protein